MLRFPPNPVRTLLLIVLLCCFFQSRSQNKCVSLFIKEYAGNDFVETYAIKYLPDGNMLVVGKDSSNTASLYDALIMKLSSDGTILWSKVLGGPADDALNGICLLNDGSFLLYGYTNSFGYTGKSLLIHMAPDGTVLWGRQMGLSASGNDRVKMLQQYSDGNIVGLMATAENTNAGDAIVFKMAMDGSLLWSQRFDNGSEDCLSSFGFDGNNIVAAGFSRKITKRAVIVTVSAADGSLLSAVRPNHLGDNYDESVNELEVFNNRVSYCFRSSLPNNAYGLNDLLLIQKDLAGNTFYSRKMSSDTGTIARRTPDGGFLLLRRYEAGSGFPTMVKLSDAGLPEWGIILSPYYNIKNVVESVDFTGSEGYVFTGHYRTFENNFRTSSYVLKCNNYGEYGECWPTNRNTIATDTADLHESAFSWTNVSSANIDLQSAVTITPGLINFSPVTRCEKQVCKDITPIPDGCNKSFRLEYSSDEPFRIRDAVTVSDGGKVIVGDRNYSGLVIKTKPNGDIEWSKTFNVFGHNTMPTRVFKTKDNNIIIFGDDYSTVNHGASTFIQVVKLDNSGNIIWSKNIQRYYYAELTAVVQGDDEGFVLLANENFAIPPIYTYVIRLDADANIVWAKEMKKDPTNWYAVYHAISYNATGIYLGYDMSQGTYTRVGFDKLDLATGNQVWSKMYDAGGTADKVSAVYAIGDTAYGFIENMVSISFSQQERNLIMVRFNPDGSIQKTTMVKRGNIVSHPDYDYITTHIPVRVTLTHENDFVLADQVIANSADTVLNITRILPNGTNVWMRQYADLKANQVYGLRTEGKGFLIIGTKRESRVFNSRFTNGFLLKVNDLGFITSNPAASCVSTNGSYTTQAVGLSELKTGVQSVDPLTNLVENNITLLMNTVVMDADLFCNEPASCNTVSIKGSGNACAATDMVSYYLENAVNCDITVTWQYDTAAFTPVQITTDSIKLMPKKAGASFITAKTEGSCFARTEQLPATVLLSAASITLGPDTTLCQGKNIELKAGAGYASYVWNDNSTGPSLTVTTPGKYYVTATDHCGGKGSDTVEVKDPSARFKLTGGATKCNNDTLMLSATAGFTNYQWLPATNIIVSNNVASVFPMQTTKYYAKATMWAGCDVTDSILVTVLRSPGIQLGADVSVCSDKKVTLDAGNGFDSYVWSNGASTATIEVDKPGKYNVLATYSNGCVSRDTVFIQHYPNTAPNLGKDMGVCDNAPLKLTPGLFKSYAWSDGTTGSTLTISGVGLYWVKVTDINGCTGADSVNVTEIYESPKNFLKDTSGICPGDELMLAPVNNYAQYAWKNGGTSKILKARQPGDYILAVTDINGCSGSDTLKVYLKDYCPNTIYFPNAFTPNHDQKNDVFRPIVTGNIEKYHFTIYNQFGQLIFASNQPRVGWDGTMNGQLQSTGNYVWVCEYKFAGMDEVVRKGTCLLIK